MKVVVVHKKRGCFVDFSALFGSVQFGIWSLNHHGCESVTTFESSESAWVAISQVDKALSREDLEFREVQAAHVDRLTRDECIAAGIPARLFGFGVVGRLARVDAAGGLYDWRDVTLTAFLRQENAGALSLFFMGGPTGHECYFVSDLQSFVRSSSEQFPLCAGTHNSWNFCGVSKEAVAQALAFFGVGVAADPVDASERFGVLATQHGHRLALGVHRSAAGFYLGTWSDDGPYTRESEEYWPTQEEADRALETGKWTQRDHV